VFVVRCGNIPVDYKVTKPRGGCVPDEHQPLVACYSYKPDEIGAAYQRWQSSAVRELADKQENE